MLEMKYIYSYMNLQELYKLRKLYKRLSGFML